MDRSPDGGIFPMNTSATAKRSIGLRAISILLILGGIAGIAVALWTEANTVILSHMIFLACAFLVFGWSIWVGFDLWKGKPQSYKWAQVLFLMQIPSVSFHGFSYQFYLGLVFSLSFTRETASKLNVEFELGSLLNFQVSAGIETLIVGVNVIAVAALIYLFRISPQRALIDRAANS